MEKTRLMRFAAPVLYEKMAEVFSFYHIHPFDFHGTLQEVEDGFEITIMFSTNFSQSVTTLVTFEQARNPDEQVIRFFKQTAEQCKTQLIADYYKMIKL
ncbi:hypothetical protein [Neobacillus dielmonensis]|uniref:hypothetical protein n=1 Tax=Neobacillus dielmonensis TaxID=1347369 RepID=UPI0005AA30BE|nr:hypothetical protein [Neobacillus dielmonensis]